MEKQKSDTVEENLKSKKFRADDNYTNVLGLYASH